MTADFDFDPSESNLRIGLELEYPAASRSDRYLVDRGRDTSELNRNISDVPVDGYTTYDGTVGLEIVSDVLYLEDAPMWYGEAIEFVEREYPEYKHQPVGLMRGGSTAGLHVHISELSEDKARDLYELSQEPWMRVLFCSSVAAGSDDIAWPVFRGGRHCQMNYDNDRYSVVNARGPGHWEWRLPEPMTPDHVHVLVEFLRAFEQSTEAAREYAQEVLDAGDDRITSIKRAEAVGIDIESTPSIMRAQYEDDPEHFYEAVESEWHYPEIYHISIDSQSFYTFDSSLPDEVEFEAQDVTFTPGSILHADSLSEVDDRGLREQVRAARNRGETEGIRETEATEELKKIIKKKKE